MNSAANLRALREDNQPPDAFSFARHQQVGTDLAETRSWLLSVGLEICTVYGAGSQAGRKAKAAIDKLDALRVELESQMALEVGPDYSPDIYFPAVPEAVQ